MFNNMLGTTLGVYDGAKLASTTPTAFGATADSRHSNSASQQHSFFTGKPHVPGLSYAFLFRNYRSDLGTADPLGYPDGWNNLSP